MEHEWSLCWHEILLFLDHGMGWDQNIPVVTWKFARTLTAGLDQKHTSRKINRNYVTTQTAGDGLKSSAQRRCVTARDAIQLCTEGSPKLPTTRMKAWWRRRKFSTFDTKATPPGEVGALTMPATARGARKSTQKNDTQHHAMR